MSVEDVMWARQRGWAPGTFLATTEMLAPTSIPDGYPFDCLFEITRVSSNEVYAKLLYEDGEPVLARQDQPLSLTEDDWREVSSVEMLDLLRKPPQRAERLAPESI